MKRSAAEIVREYGPFPGVAGVHGVTYDGRHVWFAAGDTLTALDPASGRTVRAIPVAADAGTAFDGRHLFQLAEDRIQKIDPGSGRVLATIDLPMLGRSAGLALGFAFATSLGEFGATAFLVRPGAQTLPVAIAALIGRQGAENYGMALAAAVVLGALTAGVMLLAERWRGEVSGEW